MHVAEAVYLDSRMLLGEAILEHECDASKGGMSKQNKSRQYASKHRLLPPGSSMPVNAYRASKLLRNFMPDSRKMPVCVNDCSLLPHDSPSDNSLRCPNPDCAQLIFFKGKPRKIFRTTSVRSIVATAFASRDIATELKKGIPESAHASILRGWAGEVVVASCLVP